MGRKALRPPSGFTPESSASRGVGSLADLAVDGRHRVALLQEVVGQGIAGRAEAHHEHLVAALRPGQRAGEVEGLPAREQAVDLEAPGEVEHVLERPGLRLGDVDRVAVLVLVHAGHHAVVADAVAGAGAHGVVHGDHRERADDAALGLQLLELADALFQGAAQHLPTQGIGLDAPRGGVLQAHAAAVLALALVLAVDAVMGFVHALREAGTGVGQGEALAAPLMRLAEAQAQRAPFQEAVHRDQLEGVVLGW
jgi:hypothetical protein